MFLSQQEVTGHTSNVIHDIVFSGFLLELSYVSDADSQEYISCF